MNTMTDARKTALALKNQKNVTIYQTTVGRIVLIEQIIYDNVGIKFQFDENETLISVEKFIKKEDEEV